MKKIRGVIFGMAIGWSWLGLSFVGILPYLPILVSLVGLDFILWKNNTEYMTLEEWKAKYPNEEFEIDE